MRRVVLIDLDGTLVESVDGIHQACVAMARSLRLEPPSRSFVHESIGRGADALVRSVLERLSGTIPDSSFHRTARRAFDEAYLETSRSGTRLRPDALDALDTMATEGREAIIATNKPGPASRVIVDGLGLADRIAGLVTPDEAGVRKPDPLFVEAALGGRPRSTAVLVGDSMIDAETARSSGIPFIAMMGGYNAGTPIEESEIGDSTIVDGWAGVSAALHLLDGMD